MVLYILILTPIVAALTSALTKRERPDWLAYIAVSAAIVELITAAKIVITVIAEGTYSVAPYFAVDALSALIVVIIAIVGFAATAYSVGYLRAEVKKEIIGFSRVRQFFILIQLFLLSMFLAVMVANPILMWITIEATTLSTAFLVSFYNKPASIEAAWKYLVINSVGLLLGFFGTLIFLAVASGFAAGGGLITWQDMLGAARNFDPLIMKVGFVFILIGYGTKMGLAPMHTWLPDAHSKAPTPISGLLSGVLLNVAFYAILRFKMIVDWSVGTYFSQELFLFFGLLSVLIPAFIILVQKNYKRMLAYSSIEHMGVAALGFGFGGAGVFAALLHMVYHALTKSLLFFSAGNIFLKYSSTKIYNVRGVMSALPITGVFFLAGVLAIIGLPPFGLFFTEFYILAAGIFSHPFIAAALVIGLVMVFVGFFRNATLMFFGHPAAGIEKGESGYWTVLPILLLLLLLISFSLAVPAFLQKLIVEAAKLFIIPLTY